MKIVKQAIGKVTSFFAEREQRRLDAIARRIEAEDRMIDEINRMIDATYGGAHDRA
jgi:hypothetical protein